jgi:hypothetical protein
MDKIAESDPAGTRRHGLLANIDPANQPQVFVF